MPKKRKRKQAVQGCREKWSNREETLSKEYISEPRAIFHEYTVQVFPEHAFLKNRTRFAYTKIWTLTTQTTPRYGGQLGLLAAEPFTIFKVERL